MKLLTFYTSRFVPLLFIALSIQHSVLACTDPVVLVHGNTASPSSWQNTVNELYSAGYSAQDIYLPDWGSKSCAACNNHSGSEELPVRQALSDALAQSCSGQIDVITHSMGSTLAAQQIDKLGIHSNVDAFVGIASAFRGLRSCGVYPFNVWTSTCGVYGLSVYSPFLNALYGQPVANRVYTIRSPIDQIVCSTGLCSVSGVHSSRHWDELQSYSFNLGHFGLQADTASLQVSLL